MVSIVFFNDSFLLISSFILLTPCNTVEWSLFPKDLPIFWSDKSVNVLQRYIDICLGITISEFLFEEHISSGLTWKCSPTIFKINWGVISFGLLGKIIFCNSLSAISNVILTFSRLENAISLFKAPSNSLILDFILVAT